MILYHPVFGIRFLPEIVTRSERIHRISKRNPENRSDFLDLDSDAEHQSEKSEHPTPGWPAVCFLVNIIYSLCKNQVTMCRLTKWHRSIFHQNVSQYINCGEIAIPAL